ncbi:MAG: hypothetical protein M3Q03_08060 [Chloroflexota bacterium]|nr:hypothetical protein [Chloroflexota bacterium]
MEGRRWGALLGAVGEHLVEPNHIAQWDAMLLEIRSVPTLRGKDVPLHLPKTEASFLIEGELADAGVTRPDDDPPDSQAS